jgi:hypothetical protein
MQGQVRPTTGNVARWPCRRTPITVLQNECHKNILHRNRKITGSLNQAPGDCSSPGASNITSRTDLRTAGKLRIRFDNSELGTLPILQDREPLGWNIHRRNDHRGTSRSSLLERHITIIHRKVNKPRIRQRRHLFNALHNACYRSATGHHQVVVMIMLHRRMGYTQNGHEKASRRRCIGRHELIPRDGTVFVNET